MKLQGKITWEKRENCLILSFCTNAQANPQRILSKDKTCINSQTCCGFYTWLYKWVLCFELILFNTNKLGKWNLKPKRNDSIILASLHFMLLLLLPMDRLSGCFRLFSFTECDCMSWPNFPNHWSCCKCSADLFLAYVQKVHELGGILIEDSWGVCILLFCITRCYIPYIMVKRGLNPYRKGSACLYCCLEVSAVCRSWVWLCHVTYARREFKHFKLHEVWRSNTLLGVCIIHHAHVYGHVWGHIHELFIFVLSAFASYSNSFPLTPIVSQMALSDVYCSPDRLKLVYFFLSHLLCLGAGLPHYYTDSRGHQ